MLKDDFSDLMAKFSADAESEILARWHRRLHIKQQREQFLRRCAITKRCLFGVALIGVAGAAYFANHLGGLAAQVTIRAPDPSLQAPPKSNAKHMRQLAAQRKQREEDLDEIMNQ